MEVERDLQVLEVRRWRKLVADMKKMEGYCSTGQSPHWAVVPMEEEEEGGGEDEEEEEEVEEEEEEDGGEEEEEGGGRGGKEEE